MKIEDVFGDLPELETARLRLRKFRPEDAADVFEYASDPEVARDVTWEPHVSLESSRGFIAFVQRKYAEKKVSEWAVELKENRKVIGTCNFISWFPEHARAEIGYALSRKYWGRGLMSEAACAVIAFGFERMRLHRLEARCVDGNLGSEKVLLKNGLKHEGTFRDRVWEKGAFRTMKYFSVLEDEWRKRI